MSKLRVITQFCLKGFESDPVPFANDNRTVVSYFGLSEDESLLIDREVTTDLDMNLTIFC